jgi:DNA-binding PadR family transcriptional regulator
MKRNVNLGAFEQLVLLAVLRLGDEAYAPRIARELETRAGREGSRGTLYAALERLESKGFVEWSIQASSSKRSGSRSRRFTVTASGTAALAEMRGSLLGMWDGIEHLLAGEAK